HPKAIYIVGGRLYQVEKLDFEGRKAFVREIDCDYYTDAITYTRVTPIDTFAADEGGDQARPLHEGGDRPAAQPAHVAFDGGPDLAPRIVRSHGEVHVVSRVVGFKKIKFYTNENVGSGQLDLPEHQMQTTSYWLTVPAAIMTALPYAADDRRDGVVGLSFAMRQVAQLLLMCDRHDIGISVGGGELGEVDPGRGALEPAKLSDEPRIFIYDNYPGGIGFSEPLWAMHDDLLARTRELIAGCECEHGCPT